MRLQLLHGRVVLCALHSVPQLPRGRWRVRERTLCWNLVTGFVGGAAALVCADVDSLVGGCVYVDKRLVRKIVVGCVLIVMCLCELTCVCMAGLLRVA